ncbi:MAG: type II secretion system major pseudopilin GspG [Candidatus Aureabacteria bacterium]|nr:type II secretion system major pseudopilin GspG [Candidatus Auribacterota bacterium]
MTRNQRGFTLIELLVVMVILGLLVGLVGPKLLKFIKPAQSKTARIQIANFEQAIQHYYLENNAAYPSTIEALAPEYMDDIPQDPWGRPYVYRFPGTHNKEYDIESYGPDGAPGGDDDITNYK